MKTASQLLSEANDLKQRLSEASSSLSNNDLWTVQHQLQNVCGQLLIGCQEEALEQGVERELWNLGFRNTITQLQADLKDKQGMTLSESKDVLTWFLNSASGFYLQLLHQLCSSYSLDLPFRRKDSLYGVTVTTSWALPHVKHKEGTVKNARYLCQYCLVHLGDLARYRHQARQAETFYRHAVTVGPTSGHPYNQLALLEARRGNMLSAIALYIRAVCVQAPFPKTPSNLLQTLLKVLSGSSSKLRPSDGRPTRMTKDEYSTMFLKFHAYLLLNGDVIEAKEALPQLSSALSTLVVTNALTRSMLVQMVVINMFSLSYFSGNINMVVSDDGVIKKDENTSKFIDPSKCSGCTDVIEELIVAMSAALLLPVHTIKDPEILLTYIALPAVRQLLEWLRLEEKLSCPAMRRKQQIWPGLCTLVNVLQPLLQSFDALYYEDVPLPEDWDLQGFQPLQKMLSRYKYREGLTRPSPEEYNMIRAVRLTELATWFSQQTIDDSPIIKVRTEESDDCKYKIFEPQQHLSPPPEEVRVLEQLTSKPTQIEKNKNKAGKLGILKPEGSLEKAWESNQDSPQASKPSKGKVQVQVEEAPSKAGDDDSTSSSVSGSECNLNVSTHRSRARSNVALQAILKRNSAGQESKQVTFKTPSPAISPNLSETSNDSEQSQLSTPPLVYLSDMRSTPPLSHYMQNPPPSYTSSQVVPNIVYPNPAMEHTPITTPPPSWGWRGKDGNVSQLVNAGSGLPSQYPPMNASGMQVKPANITSPLANLSQPPPPLVPNTARHQMPQAVSSNLNVQSHGYNPNTQLSANVRGNPNIESTDNMNAASSGIPLMSGNAPSSGLLGNSMQRQLPNMIMNTQGVGGMVPQGSHISTESMCTSRSANEVGNRHPTMNTDELVQPIRPTYKHNSTNVFTPGMIPSNMQSQVSKPNIGLVTHYCNTNPLDVMDLQQKNTSTNTLSMISNNATQPATSQELLRDGSSLQPIQWSQWNPNKELDVSAAPHETHSSLSPSLQQLLRQPPPNIKPNILDDNESFTSLDMVMNIGLPQSMNKLNIVPGSSSSSSNNPLASLPISQPQHPLSQEAGEGRVQGVRNYSLFSPMAGNLEAAVEGGTVGMDRGHHPLFSVTTPPPPPSSHQSLWAGPAPSPLERLLEQHKHSNAPK